MCESLITAILGFIGVIIGATLTYFFSIMAKDKELKKAFEIYQSQQASKIAELFAFWPTIGNMTVTEKQKLNQYSYELSLTLPEEIYLELSKRLINATDAKSIKEILIQLRKVYKQDNDNLKAESIIHW